MAQNPSLPRRQKPLQPSAFADEHLTHRQEVGARESPTHAQSGAVLILGLVVLLVITLIGVTGLNTTVMQERMAGNLRQNNLALQAAEAALQAGLTYIDSQTAPPAVNSSGSDHIWPSCRVVDDNAGGVDACSRLRTVLENWNGALADVDEGSSYSALVSAIGGSGDLPGVAAQPRIYIEERYVPPLAFAQAAQGRGFHYYTVTAVGFGVSDSARAIVQSTVAKVYQH